MQHLLVVLVVVLFAAWTARAGKLTPRAAITGIVLALLLYFGSGPAGLLLMAAFFVAATIATAMGKSVKQREGLAEEGGRDAAQVLANGGVAGSLAVLAFLFPSYRETYLLMIGGSFSAAAADTLSSELGSLWGRRFFNILTWKRDQRGLDGVVSLEGFAAGLLGSVLVAAVHATFTTWDISFLYIIIAGTAGNVVDSLLGATLERKGVVGNNIVNALNTLAGALVAMLLFMA